MTTDPLAPIGPGRASVPVRLWTLTTTNGRSVTGYLPGWAGDDPSEHNVPAADLDDRLSDIHHTRFFPGQRVPIYAAASRSGRPVEEEVLSCTLDCTPYAEGPDVRVPVINVHVCAESWITDLDPEGLAQVAAQLRDQADRLDNEVRPALIAAREDWANRSEDGTCGGTCERPSVPNTG